MKLTEISATDAMLYAHIFTHSDLAKWNLSLKPYIILVKHAQDSSQAIDRLLNTSPKQ